MNKINSTQITMSAILAVTIVVAGIFAFSPVEQASTVHDTISDSNDAIADLLCGETLLGTFDGVGDCTGGIPAGSTLILE